MARPRLSFCSGLSEINVNILLFVRIFLEDWIAKILNLSILNSNDTSNMLSLLTYIKGKTGQYMQCLYSYTCTSCYFC